GDEVVGLTRVRHAGHDGTANRELSQHAVIGCQRTKFRFAADLDQVVILVLTDPTRLLDPERGKQARRWRDFLGDASGKIQHDQIPFRCRGEEPAQGVEPGDLSSLEVSLLPEYMGAGQGGMTTESDFHYRGEPAETVTVLHRVQKCGLCEVHLPG